MRRCYGRGSRLSPFPLSHVLLHSCHTYPSLASAAGSVAVDVVTTAAAVTAVTGCSGDAATCATATATDRCPHPSAAPHGSYLARG